MKEAIEAKPDVQAVFEYASNLEKTQFVLDGDEDILVSGIECTPEMAPMEFQMVRDRYYAKRGGDGRSAITGEKDDGHGGKKPKEAIEIGLLASTSMYLLTDLRYPCLRRLCRRRESHPLRL